MKAHIWGNVKNTRTFPLILILLAGLAICAFEISAAQDQTGQTGSAAPATAVPAESAQTVQDAPQAAQSLPVAEPNMAEAGIPVEFPAPAQGTAALNCPPEYVPLVQKTTTALLASDFTFYPIKALDPFVPFISPETKTGLMEEEEPASENERQLTPLQKMTVAEIEKGLKAITWGDLGRKAVIEEPTGKGYIVAVGTPAGERSGVITQIFNDRLVIQQEIWDRKEKKRYPQDFVVKLVKKADAK